MKTMKTEHLMLIIKNSFGRQNREMEDILAFSTNVIATTQFYNYIISISHTQYHGSFFMHASRPVSKPRSHLQTHFNPIFHH